METKQKQPILPGGKRILVTGVRGQVGRRLLQLLGDQALGLHRDIVDLSDLESLKKFLSQQTGIVAVINPAAYTQVDLAETEKDVAMRLNRDVPHVLATWCLQQNIPFVHYSTDYVFPGTDSKPWRETDAVDPVNFYGLTKLEGEKAVVNVGAKSLIFRTSWVFDSEGKNFVKTILRLASEREELRIIDDQVGAPTHALHLAQTSLHALAVAMESKEFPAGVYHCCGAGEVSWWGFAKAIVEHTKAPLKVKTIHPIATEEFPTPAKRPKNSRMSMAKLEQHFGVKMPMWNEGLEVCLKDMGVWREGGAV
jgi:dTDP-4-dehydrorhamnose reductase